MASSSFTASGFAAGAKLAAAKRTSKSRRQSGVVTTKAAFVSSGVSTSDLKANGGRSVVELNGTKILIQEFMNEYYAVANKCPHLGLSMQGKTPLLSAEMRDDGCIVCPAHKSAFKVTTGEPVGEWCPGLPTLPLVGKPLEVRTSTHPTETLRVERINEGNELPHTEGEPTNIPVFAVQVTDSGDIEVDV